MGLSIKALGIRLVTNPAVVQLAKNGGFDALFVDLEHSTLSVNDASQICTAALQIDITPFVRVPYQCGNGFVQRVLDSGAMGVVFPHIHNKGEPLDSIENVDDIAAVDGVDVLLIGSNDLAIELGVPGQFESTEFRNALEKVSQSCHKHRKIFGLAGIYDAPEIQDWALNTLGARFILAQQDSGLIAGAGKKCADVLSRIYKQ
ncbi:Pyruvate/Phosphoenolpyruvate kinase [Penicillium expansum]|uniref:Pyruvate/Phosphoenolpyruvate kinase n=1 Tax=Penicillium expansum TaxID=27334 RepID=A0A0A2JQJ9_PENEN|nr:Pyruvate/Phosphoenolpyruvate kinase [Penicillium expansum]KGO42817.1 Pyruvate/Phosphoenolpyruvate kinase [Penicillium expansum]KGO56938.1 Pyruvate/Phosphoenolpyruvate kinase [Penicillium expansum]